MDDDDCQSGPCRNGGTCVDRVGRYECVCPPGFVGAHCEADVNECLSGPCFGPGARDCIQLVNDYRCGCFEGWTGRHCETRQSMCEARPCFNGARCIEEESTSQCQCLPVRLPLYLLQSHTNKSCIMVDWVRLKVPPTHYRSYGDGFLRVKWPNQQCQSTEGR